jgi:hypothetical protein
MVARPGKVREACGGAQNDDFAEDRARINGIDGLEDFNVHVVALASGQYFANAARHGRPGTLAMFDGRITRLQLAELYSDELLRQADGMYKPRPNDLLGGPACAEPSPEPFA